MSLTACESQELAAPKLKPDLILRHQETAQGPVLVLKDPAHDRFFRFRQVEQFILEQLDGAATLEQIRISTQEKFGSALSEESLAQFIRRLDRLGLLAAGNDRPGTSAPLNRRVHGDAFYLRLRAFNPDRLFTQWVGRLSFLFTGRFVMLSAGAVLLASGVTLVNWPEIAREFRSMFHLQSLLLAWVTVIAVIVAHEFAHGLTCKHFGGSVRELGFILIYFQPTFFCNVSDAWLFSEKSKRLWVSFAGAYFEIFVWALATLTWRVTEPHTLVNYLALVVMATSGIKTLFNLNPLIKLDGYYLLSDYLEIPNLRRKAFAYLRERLGKLWGGTVRRLGEVAPRERRIYLIYGLLAAVYSYGLFSFFVMSFGRFLVHKYQGWGFAVLTTLLVILFRQPLQNFQRVLASHVSSRHGMLAGVKRIVRLLAFLVPTVAVLYFCRMELKIGGEFIILPAANAEVRAEVEGIIQDIVVGEGDPVKKGDVLVRLSARDYLADLQKVKAEVDEKQAKLRLLKAGTRPEEIELGRTAITKAEERLKYGRNQLTMDKTLFEQNLQSRREYELTEELVAVREKELEEAKRKLDVLLAGSRVEEVEAIEAEVKRLRGQQLFLEEQCRLLVVTSPISGVITTPKLKEKLGQNIKKGELIALVHELASVTAEISVPEKEIADVKLGQKVLLKVRAYPESRFSGVVCAIAPAITKQDDTHPERTIRVSTHLENPKLLLRSEMSGNAKIFCGERRVLELIGRRLVRYIRVEFWSWW